MKSKKNEIKESDKDIETSEDEDKDTDTIENPDDKAVAGNIKDKKAAEEAAKAKAIADKKETAKENLLSKINAIVPMANLNNRIRSFKALINPNQSGMGTSERAVMAERKMFVNYLESIRDMFVDHFKK